MNKGELIKLEGKQPVVKLVSDRTKQTAIVCISKKYPQCVGLSITDVNDIDEYNEEFGVDNAIAKCKRYEENAPNWVVQNGDTVTVGNFGPYSITPRHNEAITYKIRLDIKAGWLLLESDAGCPIESHVDIIKQPNVKSSKAKHSNVIKFGTVQKLLERNYGKQITLKLAHH